MRYGADRKVGEKEEEEPDNCRRRQELRSSRIEERH
jgi:hypothetical protein